VCSLAGRYDNPIPPRFLAAIDFLKIPAQACRYYNPILTRFPAPTDCSKIPALESDLKNKVLEEKESAHAFACLQFKQPELKFLNNLLGLGTE
jgi:hypothetical protein